MKRILILIIAIIITQPMAVLAQAGAVNWSAVSGGFTLASPQSGLLLMMSEGQPFVERASGSSLVVGSGFLVHPTLSGFLLAVPDEDNIPEKFSLEQNYPNPFNPSTTFSFAIPHSSFLTLKVYDLLGREVAMLVNEEKTPGTYKVTFDAAELASGVYFYRLQTSGFVATKKLMLVK
jgi:hypothetical protein